MDRFGFYLAYLYLLRVPLLAWLLLVFLPFLSVPAGAPFGSLLRGIFDLSSDNPYQAAFSLCTVTFFGFMAGVAIGITARLILLDGRDRFGAGAVPPDPGVKLMYRLIPLSAPLPLILFCVLQTYSGDCFRLTDLFLGVAGIAVGVLLFFFVMVPLHNLLWEIVVERPDELKADVVPSDTPLQKLTNPFLNMLAQAVTAALWIAGRLVRLSPAGYVRRTLPGYTGPPTLLPRHSFAVIHSVISLAVYIAVFVFRSGEQADLYSPAFPTLCLVLILLMLLCLTLSALTFFFDRYRIPLLSLLAIFSLLSSILPQGDHFYSSKNLKGQALPAVQTAPSICVARNDLPTVVVAASGGGIQSAAWTAIVLSGLKQAMQDRGSDFDCSIRVISSVSGGSVGAMYFADAYRSDGTLPPVPPNLGSYPMVQSAEASSLDAVAWGLAYPDVFWSIFPVFKGVSLNPPALLHGRGLTSDRGTALENAWRLPGTGLGSATLSAWRNDAANRRRPAVIFNATLVETGKRFLIPTTAVGSVSLDGEDSTKGREVFDQLYRDRDLDIVTAARLSATFPYATPAARIWRQDVFAKEPHVADGGYYDNYGIVSLLDWLDSPPSWPSSAKKVIVVQIRAFPTDKSTLPASNRGWFFQAEEPVKTLAAVRDTGQFSHNQVDMIYAQRKSGHPFSVCTVSFEFPADDDLGKPYDPPLSWHLTPSEKKALLRAWSDKRVQASVVQFKKEFGP